MEGSREQIRFDDADEAYLVAAALRRYRDGSVDVVLIPTDDGPALDIDAGTLDDPFVRAILQRFNGRSASG